MKSTLATIVTISLCVSTADAGDAVTRVDFETLLALAQKNPRASAARYATKAARARIGEAKGLRFPKISINGFIAPSPDIECLDTNCIQTNNRQPGFTVGGVFGSATIQAVQPIYAFGKIGAAVDAARSAAAATRHLEDAVAGDQAVDAATVYYGVKLARELTWMLEDGDEQIGKAIGTIREKLEAGEPDVTLQDRLRVETLRGEVKARLSEARSAQAEALASMRALAGKPTIEVTEDPLDAVAFTLGKTANDFVASAHQKRPELAAIKQGEKAAKAAASLESSRFLPDLFLLASVGFARATGVDDSPSAFANDRFNRDGAALALVMRWTVDPMTQWAQRQRRLADAQRAGAMVSAVQAVASLEVKRTYARAKYARRRMEATRSGERSARGWLAAVLQADAVGTAEAKDLADAYIAYFGIRARLLQAIFDWNVTTVRLRRAAGEFRAGAPK